jgi:hypothetical protein
MTRVYSFYLQFVGKGVRITEGDVYPKYVSSYFKYRQGRYVAYYLQI